MALTLNGTTGIAGANGSASTPAVQGEDTNTGVFFPAADTVAVATGGTERVRVDSSGNVGIGTSSPGYRLQVYNNINGTPFAWGNAARTGFLYQDANGVGITNAAATTFDEGVYLDTVNSNIALYTNSTERLRIDSSGNLLVGTTSLTGGGSVRMAVESDGAALAPLGIGNNAAGTGSSGSVIFRRNGSGTGSISVTGSATSYTTSSDYRLKENVAPMQNALNTVAQLNPVTYTWKADGSAGQGFIAHELQAVVPDCVTGEKDAVDADGNPQYQGVDTSFLVATLVKALQEQQALITAFETRLAALEAK
jgi:hypothetical protein